MTTTAANGWRAAAKRSALAVLGVVALFPSVLLAASPAAGPPPLPPVPEGASVYFVEPSDGAHFLGPLVDGTVAVKVAMGARGIEVKPAGPVLAGSGHHHILIDTGPMPAGQVVPSDATHLHFGKAQTRAVVSLAPGEHTLTLQLADGIHRSYGPELAASITIHVEGAK